MPVGLNHAHPISALPTLPEVRLRFLSSLLCFSWAAAIAPSTERELGETLGMDTRCLLPMPVWDASEPLSTVAPPSTLQSPGYVHEASLQ